MKLHQSTAEIFVPDGEPVAEALKRITHLGIGAHLEFMAFHGILNCFTSEQHWFGGVTCTNGSGSSRTGPYANLTDAQMMVVRRREQNAAATVGRYGVMLQLDYPSSASAGDFLTPPEKKLLAFSKKLITFEIGIRFLADFLGGDTYFKGHREGHNLDRCRTQFKLVDSIEQQEEQMNKRVEDFQ